MKERDVNKLISVGPNEVGVGRFRYEMFAVESKNVLLDNNVVKFLVSKQFNSGKENIVKLGYVSPQSLGFTDSVLLKSVLKGVKGLGLSECPMDTAVNLSGLMATNRQSLEKGVSYYVVSEKWEGDSGFGEGIVPNFLRVNVSSEGQISVSGWNENDMIPAGARVVFKQE